ncbi:MAG TPA: YihY/virulence factor BrkB family protein [Candidatus Omnitrophica bacterium]|nr:YihY/virulence factor BrkB family protein [Candidatus Omnitrophota bacterium]
MAKIIQFITNGMWRVRARKLSRPRSFFLRTLRVMILSFKEFGRDKCTLHASALTFFSLLSIVPVFAMAFGIAKGFGFEKMLHDRLMEMDGQQEVIQRVVQFSETMLQNTKGGVIAGIGILLLFWSVIQVLQNIEKSFNHIFAVQKERTMARKLADYLAIMLICPVLVILSGSLTVFISTQVTNIMAHIGQAGELIGPLAVKCLSFLPYVIFWLLLTFLYVVMPNTRVRKRSALVGGIVAGTIYQLVQVLYIKSQMVASNFGAVYGSFAALPLFLVWLQLSWQIVLYGAELAFAHQNEETYEFEEESRRASLSFQKSIALLVTQAAVKRFCDGEKPLELHDFAEQYDLPIRLVRGVAEKLEKAGVLSPVEDQDKNTELYQPARDVADLTVLFVLTAWDDEGAADLGVEESAMLLKLKSAIAEIRRAVASSPSNALLKNL